MDGNYRATIISGSKSDESWVNEIRNYLKSWGIPNEWRIGSAHKSTDYVLEILDERSEDPSPEVLIPVAGLTDALSGVCAANCWKPVIACPPQSNDYGGISAFTSLNAPKGVPSMTVLNPKTAAYSVGRIFAAINEDFRKIAEKAIPGTYSEILRSAPRTNSRLADFEEQYIAIISGAKEADCLHAKKIGDRLKETWEIPSKKYIVFEKKDTTAQLRNIMREYESNPHPGFAGYIVSDDFGISKYLTDMTIFPVIHSCSAESEKFSEKNIIKYIHSLRNSASIEVLRADNAADAIGRIAALKDEKYFDIAKDLMQKAYSTIVKDDKSVSGLKY